MKKIILPTDFSDNAWNTIAYAQEFFKNEECEFHILHTYMPTFYRVDYAMGGPAFSAIPDTSVDTALAGLDKTLEKIKLEYQNKKHRYKTRSTFNTLTNEIIELSEKEDFDLILMGTQGATGAKEIFLGTNTVHVIRKSKVPVMAIPNGYRFKEIKSIVFPTDYRSLYKKEEMRFLLDAVKMHQAKLTILHIKAEYELTDDQELSKELLSSYFKDIPHVFTEQRGALMPEAVHEYVEQYESELLVMMNRKHGFLERWLFKQNIDSIGFHTNVPFLVLRDTVESKYKKS